MSDTPRSMAREDLFKLDWLQTAQLSPDASQIAYTVSHIEGKEGEEKEYSTIYLLDVATGTSRKMTNGKQMDTSPAWSPDGKTIAFVSNRTEKNQIYLLPVDGGEAQALADMKQGAGGPVWSPDGSKIAFTAGVDYGEDEAPDRSKQPYRVTRNIWRFDDIGDIDLAVNNLYVMDVASREVTQMTDHDLMVRGIQWHPDSSRILYGTMMKPDQWYGFRTENFIIDLEKNAEPLLHDWISVNHARWTPDGSKIIFVGEKDEPIIGTHSDMWVMDTQTGTVSNRSAGMERSIAGGLEGRMPAFRQIRPMVHVDADGNSAFIQVQEGGHVSIMRFALSGDVAYEKVITGDRACTLLDMQGDTLVYASDDITHTPDVFVAKSDGTGEKQFTHINDAFLADIIMPESVFLQFKGSDGTDVEGWYVKPTTGGDGPYPTILWIHGGPHGAQGNRFAFDTLMLNGAGYGVMFVNHRASTGYGNAFSTGIHGDWGNLDYKDLMAGVDYAIELGLADPDKLGCCGISGGGNLSCWIVGQTDRFKAAVPQNPVTSWLSFYGVSDIGVWFSTRQLGGHPHEIPEIYTKCSPLTYAHKCTTPTLMIQTERDFRCPVDQSEQFYTTLRANGCIVEMLRQPQGSHGGSIRGPLPIRTENLKAKLEWFNKYIMGLEA
ncbi:MAG: S9 family peptidase [Anaerolineaceae bacterium]|nr:S9 family peptidase [Anaerolineaceae bacterium]